MFLAAATNIPPAALALIFCAVFAIVFALWILLRGAGESREDRARRRIGAAEDAPVAAEASQESIFRAHAIAKTGKGFARLPFTERVQGMLDQADLSMKVSTFMGLIAGLGLFGIALGFLISKSLIYGVVFGAVISTLPYGIARFKVKQRVKKFTAQFPDALELMSNSLRAGHAFTASIGLVAEEMADPISSEFRRVFEEQNYGMPLDDALQGLMKRVDSLDLKFFAIAVMIQKETGGNMAEILENIGHTMRERFKILGQVQTLTAQGRLSGWVLGFLPLGLGTALYLMNPHYMDPLFAPGKGRMLVGLAVGLQVTGFLLIRKIINIKV